jgi:hypothetical protein
MEQVLYTKTPPGFTNLQMHRKNCQGNTRNKTFDQKEKSMSIVFKKKKGIKYPGYATECVNKILSQNR